MNVRRAMATDYEELCRWWVGHGWDVVPFELLPMGFVVEDEQMMSAGFIYIAQGAPVAYFEYIVTNPDNSPRESYKAIDLLMTEVMKFLEYNMIKACFCRIAQESLGRLYKKHGFKDGDNLKDMIWIAS